MISEIGEQYTFDIMALQEICIANEHSNTDTDISFHNGHGLVVCPPKPGAPAVGFLIHRSWIPYVSVGAFGHRCGCLKVHLDCGLTVTCISGHCGASADMEDFERCLEALDALIPGPHRGPILIGIDANAILGSDIGGEDDRFEVPGPCRAGVANAHGRFLSSWLCCRGLVASSTFSCDAGSFETRIPDDHDFFSDYLPSQIDYIISDNTTHALRHNSTHIDQNISELVCTDHYGVSCNFILRNASDGTYLRAPHTSKAHQKHNTWTINAEKLQDFQNEVSGEIKRHEDLQTLNENILATVFHKAAASHGQYSNSRFQVSIERRKTKSSDEMEVLDARKQATSRAERVALTKELWKIRRRDRRLHQENQLAQLFDNPGAPDQPQRLIYRKQVKIRQQAFARSLAKPPLSPMAPALLDVWVPPAAGRKSLPS